MKLAVELEAIYQVRAGFSTLSSGADLLRDENSLAGYSQGLSDLQVVTIFLRTAPASRPVPNQHMPVCCCGADFTCIA
jgi:hypothetical protein